MRSYLNEWNEAGLVPAGTEDFYQIEFAEEKEIELRYDDMLHVYNEAGVYIADLKQEGEHK